MADENKKFECKNERAHPRYGYGGNATLRREDAPDEEASILDLSMTGCLLGFASPVTCTLGDHAEVHLRSAYLSFRAIGCIRHCGIDGRSMGFSFERLTSRSKDDLRAMIEDLEIKALELAASSS